ncbi:MAG: HINT domain-containing protein [Prevotella sp.]|nr:HINT domain-containing protein [Muribaculaceae bacterium]MCM1350507.1 HINT domain-containing protein [Prevotella sp.]
MAIFIASIGVSQLFKNCYTDCFIAGTMVLTSIGLVKIEDIQVGDEVWAYDEETKEKALKKVKQLFRKETKEWMHLFIENPISKVIEEIICTPSHRICIEGKGWIKASNIIESDEVLLYNNASGIVQRIELEKLEQPEETYNFEVEDYHNYFVSEECVLVHNDCEESLLQQRALAARDEKVTELRSTLSKKDLRKVATVVGGYNKATSKIAVGVKYFDRLPYCAETLVVEQLGGMGQIHNIVMTAAIRPYNLAIVSVCEYCQSIYSISNFMIGTTFR